MKGFLPDGGIGLYIKAVTLPTNIILTSEALAGQPLIEYYPGKTLISHEVFGWMFSFLVPMKPDAVIAHLEAHALLALTNFRAGKLETSATTGEKYRWVSCDILI
jgi:hypothetical protein